MPLRDKSVTLMRFYGFPHHGDRFFAGAQNDAFRSPSLWRFPFPITSDVLSPNRHSERWQECFVGKTGNGTVTQSEESITLMTSYRLPHHGRRSFFTFVQDDAFRSPSFSTFSWRLTADSSQLIADSFYLLTVFLTTAVKNLLSEWYEKMWK